MTAMLSVDNSVLLVVDIQEKFAPILPDSERLIQNAGILIDAARELGVPIVVSEQYPKGLGHTVPQLLEKLPAENAAVLEKTAFGCFEDSGIRAHLAALGRRQVLVCGLETHICVNQTAHQLLHAGYEVHIAEDAVASRAEQNREIALRKLRHSGAIASCVEMALFEWIADAKHPRFKQVQALIK